MAYVRELRKINGLVESNAASMMAQDGQAPGFIRKRDVDKSIEAPRALEGSIERVHPIGGSDDDDVAVHGRVKAVHLHKYLIQRLVLL